MFIRSLLVALVAIAAPAAGSASADTPIPSLTVSRENGFTVPVRINGTSVRLRVDPGINGIILNPGTAARLALGDSLRGATAQVGRIRVPGYASIAQIEIEGQNFQRRLMWFERDIIADAEGVIGIADLPSLRTTLQLRAPVEGESSIALPVQVGDGIGLFHRYRVAREEVRIFFRLWQETSQATAAAGAHLAAHHGGRWAGDAFEGRVLLGVARPLRPMTFSTPLALGGVTIDRVLVRTSDYAGRFVLPDDPDADPNEVVVTGSSRGRTRARLILALSEDRLGACSSITYEREARRLILRCRTNG